MPLSPIGSTTLHDGPITIEFRELTVTVTDRDTRADKSILRNVRGIARPGRLLAIMGQSGAGKSTLLDVLAANKFSGTRVEGILRVNGEQRDRREFLRNSCYVQQQDVLLAAATVRECIVTSALLKLPASMTKEEKLQRVDSVISELELGACSNVLIGDESIGLKGVSGGQKRRVSLAIELVKDPKVIFADEPTSGLDSEVALSIVDALVQLSRKNRTVVCTIHQPNSNITSMFDDYMLLAMGRIVYGGKWSGAVDFFAAAGHATPMYQNPTDYFMSIVRDADVAEAMANKFEESCVIEDITSAEQEEATEVAISLDEMELGHGSSHGPKPASSLKKPVGRIQSFISISSFGGTVKGGSSNKDDRQATIWTQMQVLLARNIRNWLRNPVMLASELIQYVAISIFVGLMYCQFTDELEDGIFDRSACIWFAFAIMCFTPAYTACTAWDKERSLLKRELQQQQYSLTAFYLARSAVLVPLTAAQCILFVSIMYFFCGFQAEASKFFLFIAVLIMFQITSEGLGLIAAILTKTATYAIIILTFALLLLLSFSGFLVSRIPPYFIWIGKISYLTYAYAALLESELDGLWLDDNGTSVEAIDYMPHQIDTGLSIGVNVGILAAMMVAMEVGKLLSMHVAHRLRII